MLAKFGLSAGFASRGALESSLPKLLSLKFVIVDLWFAIGCFDQGRMTTGGSEMAPETVDSARPLWRLCLKGALDETAAEQANISTLTRLISLEQKIIAG